jgi:FkbM family methyltransferase
MELFARIIQRGQTVLEVGGHIGYVALYLGSLVGPAGQVWVFEPGPNNLPYTRRNLGGQRHIHLVEKGAGSDAGRAAFFVEDLTGQNNSFVRDFDQLELNRRQAGVGVSVRQIEVEVTTLDLFSAERSLEPAFIKIDVEGFEFQVLRGAAQVLQRHKPALMVEIQADHVAIAEFARSLGYTVIDEERKEWSPRGTGNGNTFWLHREAHRALIAELAARK